LPALSGGWPPVLGRLQHVASMSSGWRTR
jgi:hypothetical protein